MTEKLLLLIAGELGAIGVAFCWLVGKVWSHEARLKGVEDAQGYCPQHFKLGGSS